jgi:hypothetical protein
MPTPREIVMFGIGGTAAFIFEDLILGKINTIGFAGLVVIGICQLLWLNRKSAR